MVVVTVFVLAQLGSALYAVAIVLFALSVSAAQCKDKLKITAPIFFINACVVCTGVPSVIYLYYAAFTVQNPTPGGLITAIAISIYIAISLMNVIIIRNLYLPEYQKHMTGD